MRQFAVVVLAAGMGTRMKSAVPKVLHKAAGRSLLGHVLTAIKPLEPARTVIVAGPQMPEVEAEARRFVPDCKIAIQEQRNGTGHAVSMAKDHLSDFSGTVIVVYADVPLIKSETLRGLASKLGRGTPMAVLGFEAANPQGYGRLIPAAKGHIKAIREELDASPKERKIKLCNSGVIAIDSKTLWQTLPKIKPNNAKGEIYLTDLVELVVKAKGKVGVATCGEIEVMGVNDRTQLAHVSGALQDQYRTRAMLGGATLIDPSTVYLSADTQIGQDVVVEPNVVFGPGVNVGNGAEILANCHIEGATIGEGARIGPFARLRPGAHIGANAHVGNYVEIKNAALGAGAKANHLSYIGDATVGAKSNIGAGTITCNYDGYAKHKTEIGSGVFVGSNTALVAPVKIGDGVNIAAGSVVTKDVPADALAIGRAELSVREGWAKRYREIMQARKSAKT
ncbi:MAG: bifunctional UDP-N-acetylglucosamine diphosphorylase/glucosamine-1-phosphate N-acetyltransferase GlmU [Aestuariivirga sp.]